MKQPGDPFAARLSSSERAGIPSLVHMRTCLLLVLGILLALQGCAHAEETGDGIISITSNDADALLTSGTWLVEFYAPWCGFCQRLEPTYAEVAAELTPQGVKVAKIDGTKNQALSARFGVEGFPTIFHIHEGEVRSYDNDRTKEMMVWYALHDWEKHKPAFGSLTAPFGIPKRGLGMLVESALTLQALYDHMRQLYGLSQPVAIGISLLATILIGTGLGFILSLVFPHPAARAKRD